MKKENINIANITKEPIINNIISLSTSHLSFSTTEQLINAAEDICMLDYMEVYEKGDYGFFVYIKSPDLLDCKNKYKVQIPYDLYCCLNFALQHNCLWICFDCDAPISESLKNYDWVF